MQVIGIQKMRSDFEVGKLSLEKRKKNLLAEK